VIVRRVGDELWVVLHQDHMDLAGDLARIWGNEEIAGPRRPAEAAVAVRVHDEPWRLWDRNLEQNADGYWPWESRPEYFAGKAPTQRHARDWYVGIDLAARFDPYAALLVSMHGSGLYLNRYGIDGDGMPEVAGLPEWTREYLAEESALQEKLRTEAGASEEEVWHDYRLFEAWNRLSLVFCQGLAGRTLTQIPLVGGGETRVAVRLDEPTLAALDPFPFPGDRQGFGTRIARLPDRAYDGPDDFLGTLTAAEPETVLFQAVRA
jgi:hypothetical protein